MSSHRTQDNRVGELTTPLGKDVLLLTAFEAEEGLGRLFEISVECIGDDENIDFSRILGRECHIKLKRDGGATRNFSGVAVEADWTDSHDKVHGYRIVLRPWLWLLTQTSDNRIFQNRSVLSIIKRVFKKAGFAGYEIKTTESYARIEYCVQYGETHFDFVSRLMQTYGIYYYFRHTEDRHILVLADGRASHKSVPELPVTRYVPFSERSRDTLETLNIWRPSRRFRTGKVTVRGFDFDKPNAQLTSERSAGGGHAHDDLERYDYPALFKSGEQDSLAQTFVRARLHAMQGQDRRRHAEGDLPALFPGGLTKLSGHPVASENLDYLVVSARHSFVEAAYASSLGGAPETIYKGAYEFQPAARPFKSPLATPKPTINGPQTATVAGPAGEEIYTDKHGRIKVQFHWDRLGRKDEKSSRWIRVAQVWSGATWGGMVIPRIGQEVVVEFIEGDPDRPLVTGTVFNGEKTTAYDLPANKTRMVLRSATHKGTGFNEVSFEDENGRQNLLMHAQKDMTQKVLNNHTARVDNSMATSVGAHASTEIGGNHASEVGGSQTNVVGATGPGVMAALAPLMGLMGQSAGLLGEAAGLAGGLGSIQGLVSGVVGQAAQALIGAAGQQGRSGVLGSGTKGDMGTALAGAGTQLLQGVGQMFGQSGVQKNFISQAQVTAVGQASTETVGKTKVVNVGATFFTQVGNAWHLDVGKAAQTKVGETWQLSVGKAAETKVGKTHVIDVGETFEITAGEKFSIKVGEARFQMDKMGVITIEGAISVILKGGAAQLTTGPGPILYVPVLVPGKTPTPPANCLRRMSESGTPFVRM